ncbi:MAG: YetF domain-containing protein [Dyadobacter sp.]
MDKFFNVDWHAMFIPSLSLLEIFLRGTLTYWVIYLCMRLFRRGTGQLGIADLLLITMISDAAQNAMAGTYNSISEGAVLILTLVFWDYAIDWMGYKKVIFGRLAKPEPVLLVRNGRMLLKNMEKELIDEEELFGLLREKDVDDYTKIKTCYLEATGNISVILKE